MPERKADLHVHTPYSDGTDPLDEIIRQARGRRVSAIAVTDHDTTEALRHVPEHEGVDIIPGIEFSTWHDGVSVHVLGYFIDIDFDELEDTLTSLKKERRERGLKIMDNLEKYEGIRIDRDIILSKGPEHMVGRMDIARALVRMKLVKTPAQAFERYIGDGMPCYVSTRKISTAEAAHLIKRAGGIPVLAHPGVIRGFDDYDALIDTGLEGIEVFYPKHSQGERQFFYDLAVRRNILITGGSDFHGRATPGRNKLGAAYLSEKYLEKLYEYNNERKR